MQTRTKNSLCGLLLAAACAAGATTASAASLECGGIGSEDSRRMLGERAGQSATLVFASRSGAYVSGVRTRVVDAEGREVATADCGPIGQLNVDDSGRYHVHAEHDGERLEQALDLTPRGGAHVVLRFQDEE